MLISIGIFAKTFNCPSTIRALQFEKEYSCFVFCDFSKSFNKVSHKGFIHKINSYGIQGNLIKWFENYLYKRKQKVINKNSCSSFEHVSAGVPQGSVFIP